LVLKCTAINSISLVPGIINNKIAKGVTIIDQRFDQFSCDILRVMLDALAYYLETKEQRREDLLQLKAKYDKRLDYYVVMAQLDTNAIDLRDEINSTLSLIVKKLECYEEYLKDAENLFKELLTYLVNKE